MTETECAELVELLLKSGREFMQRARRRERAAVVVQARTGSMVGRRGGGAYRGRGPSAVRRRRAWECCRCETPNPETIREDVMMHAFGEKVPMSVGNGRAHAGALPVWT